MLEGGLPDDARAAAAGVADLVPPEEAAGAEGVLVPAGPDGARVARVYRDRGGRLPVYALSSARVTVADRIRWIREGGDDLLALAELPAALERKLAAGALRPTAGDGPVAERVDRWLRAAARYLSAREEILADLGKNGRTRYLDAVFLRDHVVRAGHADGGPDAFGQRRRGDREALDWPARLSAPIPVDARVQQIGAEGACLSLPVAPGPGERLVAEVAGKQVTGRLELEVRWLRRVARGRWQVGVFSIACTLAP